MRLRLVLCLAVAAVLVVPMAAAAQNREPHALSVAIGGDLGVFVPDEELHATFSPDAFVEFYVFGRMSIRAMAAWARPAYVSGDRSLDQLRGTVNVLFNWEKELWHPFITAGAGAYAVQLRAGDETVGSRSTKSGFNAGGGIEYFWAPKVAVKVEATYHWVRQGDLPGGGASGLAISAGLKKYF